MKVAVVGGGWAGLATAVELTKAGAKVTVFEAARHLGGRARSLNVHGYALDNGQHILLGSYRETLRLMKIIGAEPERMLKRLPLELNFPGSSSTPFCLRLPRLPAPFHLAFGLMAIRGVSLSEKIGAVRFIRALQARDYQFDVDCTVADLLDRHAQHGNLRIHMWEALCLAALNTEPRNASAQIFANVLRDSLGGCRADTDLLLPAFALDQLFPRPAANFIRTQGGEIRLSSRITRIDDLTIDGSTYDQIVLAVAPQHAATFVAQRLETADIAALLTTYVYEPIGTVYLGYPPTMSLPFAMLGLNGGNSGGFGQWVFDRGPLGGAAGVMSFVLSANGAWYKQDNATLAVTLHSELEEALNKKLPAPLWHQIIRERRATFSCRPNLPRPAAKTQIPGIWLAGDYVCADYPATLEGAVRSGVAVAQSILLRSSSSFHQ
jgi:squalene-associated FAD-dependent desaturase